MLLAATYNTDPDQPVPALRPGYLQLINCPKENVVQEFRMLLEDVPDELEDRSYTGVSDQALAMMVRHARFIPANDQDTCISVFLTAPYHIMCGYNR
jgi:hypothetical protein